MRDIKLMWEEVDLERTSYASDHKLLQRFFFT